MKIRTKLLISFAVILLMPSIAIGWSSYQTAKNKLHEELMHSAQQNVEFFNHQITELISAKINEMDYFSANINAGMVDD